MYYLMQFSDELAISTETTAHHTNHSVSLAWYQVCINEEEGYLEL